MTIWRIFQLLLTESEQKTRLGVRNCLFAHREPERTSQNTAPYADMFWNYGAVYDGAKNSEIVVKTQGQFFWFLSVFLVLGRKVGNPNTDLMCFEQ